jgi:hypothetical protein
MSDVQGKSPPNLVSGTTLTTGQVITLIVFVLGTILSGWTGAIIMLNDMKNDLDRLQTDKLGSVIEKLESVGKRTEKLELQLTALDKRITEDVTSIERRVYDLENNVASMHLKLIESSRFESSRSRVPQQ